MDYQTIHRTPRAPARISGVIRLKLRAMATHHSRRLGFRIGLAFGETDEGQQWAAVGSWCTDGPLVSVLAGAGTSGGYVLTDRWGRCISSPEGLHRAVDVLDSVEQVLKAAAPDFAAVTPKPQAAFTAADVDRLEALRRDLRIRTGRAVTLILEPAAASGAQPSRAVLALERFGVLPDGSHAPPAPLVVIEAASHDSAPLIDAARFAAMREYRLLCRGEPAGETTPTLTEADLPRLQQRAGSTAPLASARSGAFTAQQFEDLQALAHEVSLRIKPASASVRLDGRGDAILAAVGRSGNLVDLLVLGVLRSQGTPLIQVRALVGPESRRGAYRAAFPDAVRAAVRVAVRAWRAAERAAAPD